MVDSAVRLDGTTKQYVIPEFPAAANPELTIALRDAAVKLKKRFSVGMSASTDSFFTGQSREGFGGYISSHSKTILQDMRAANVSCFEMECGTLFTLGKLYGIQTGAVLAVVANRVTNEFDMDHKKSVEDAIEVAIKSLFDLKK